MAGPAAASHPSPPPFAVFASKVKPPAAGSGTIARTPLLNRLRTQSTAVRLVTVVAPPGYGKTTLLAQWAARDERPFAWLTAEPDDAAPLVLLRHLAVALREIGAADRSAFTALREPDAADRSEAAALLANGLAAAPEPFVLVVDDADRIPSGPAGQIVAALADAVPAGSLLVLAGRHAPAIGTARRRAGDTLLELTGRDLAFSPRDVKLYATAVRPGIEDELVGELHHRTEGWPAAVTLALRALRPERRLRRDGTRPDRALRRGLHPRRAARRALGGAAGVPAPHLDPRHAHGAAVGCRARLARRRGAARGARSRRAVPDPARPAGDVVPVPPDGAGRATARAGGAGPRRR
jgi:hypothetical protein